MSGETQEFDEEIPFDEEDDEGEDLFADDVLVEDYREAPTEEDFYDEQYLDNEDYQPINYQERMRAEEAMDRREELEENENELEQAIERSERREG